LAFAMTRAEFGVCHEGLEYGGSLQSAGYRRGPTDEKEARGDGRAHYLFDPSKHLTESPYYDA